MSSSDAPLHDFAGPYVELRGKAKDARRYMNIPSAVLEFNLRKFEEWYKAFSFAESMEHLEEENWVFRIVMLFPEMLNVEEVSRQGGVKTRPKDEVTTEFNKYAKLAYKLYNKLFAGQEEVLNEALIKDPTIMLLAYKKPSPKTTTNGISFCNITNGVKTVSAVTFRPSSFLQPGPAYITWLGVSDANSTAPKRLGSWRRHGYATFMIVHVIKFCASRRAERTVKNTQFKKSLDQLQSETLSLFLQCSSDESTYQFYVRLGFEQINKDLDNDGIQLLPPSLIEKLSDPDDPAFRRFESTTYIRRPMNKQSVNYVQNIECAPRLMHLAPGRLRFAAYAVGANDDDEPLSSKRAVWCRFPMYLPNVPRNQSILSSDEMNTVVLKDLNLLRDICPFLKAKVPLLSPRNMNVHGDMLVLKRLQHTKSEGTEWLDTFALDMMLAFWLRDGRYDACATVIAFQYIAGITNAFKAHQRLKSMHQLLVGKENLSPIEQSDIVVASLNMTPDEIRRLQQSSFDYVVKNVILPNPGLLEKGIIIIPSNPSDAHWIATFIFNAGHVMNQKRGQPRACFFRYCPQEGTGAASQPTSCGVVWLLNLVHSYWSHKKQQPCPTSMAWTEPFGSLDTPMLIGTQSFPSLRVAHDDTGVFPVQTDIVNCGVAVVASIGMVLRDLATISKFESFSRLLRVKQFVEVSRTSRTEEPEEFEFITYLPMGAVGMTSRARTINDEQNYLAVLREQFFIAFDRLAQFQHIRLRTRLKMSVPKKRKLEFQQLEQTVTSWPCSSKLPIQPLSAEKKQTENMDDVELPPTVEATKERPPVVIAIDLSPLRVDEAKKQTGKTVQLPSGISGSVKSTTPPKLSSVIVDTAMSMLEENAAAKTLGSLATVLEDSFSRTMRESAKVTSIKTVSSVNVAAEVTKEDEVVPSVLPGEFLKPGESRPEQSLVTEGEEDNVVPSLLTADNDGVQFVPGESCPVAEVSQDGDIVPPAVLPEESLATEVSQDGDIVPPIILPEESLATEVTEDDVVRLVLPEQSLVTQVEEDDVVPTLLPTDDDGVQVDKGHDQAPTGVPTCSHNILTGNPTTDLSPPTDPSSAGVEKADNLKTPKQKCRRRPKKKKSTSMPPPGRNVWKYLMEVDRRRLSYKQRGKTFFIQTPEIEERLDGEKATVGYADSDSDCSINTQEDAFSTVNGSSKQEAATTSETVPLISKPELKSVLAVRGSIGFSEKVDLNSADDLDSIDKQAMAHFVEKSFVAWGWSNNETHQQEICQYQEMGDSVDDPGKKKLFKLLVQGMRNERTKFRRQFENEFLFTRPGYVKGIQFKADSQKFYARMEYKVRNPVNKKEMVKKVVTNQVTERWIRDEFPPEVVQHVVDMALQENGFSAVPDGVSMQLLDQKVVRVRYTPPQRRYILDAQKIREIGEAALAEKRLLKKAKQAKAGVRSSSRNKNYDDDLPRKEVITEARWVVKFADGKTMVVGEELVREHFGDVYTEELKSLRRGFVDIPVGDSKASRLHLYPDLSDVHAPKVVFNQTEGRDLCVPKALASVLYQLGFTSEASQIDAYGEEHLYGGAVDSLQKVCAYARKILPTYIQGRKLPRDYDWKTLVKDDVHSIVLGVISAADGSNSHAIAIHGGYIYDANETVALLLSTEALNYCASNESVQTEFVTFRKGYIYAYDGQKPGKIARMTLQTTPTCGDCVTPAQTQQVKH